MAIRFTKYGLRELKLYGGLSGLVAAAVLVFAMNFLRLDRALLVAAPFLILFGLVVMFFRDPKRVPPRGEHRLVSPADGMVYDIGEVDEPLFLGEKALRIGVFLSVFDCHVNRAPCSGTVEKIVYRRGTFFSALNAKACSERNESNFVGLSNAAGRGVKVGVKQIAGQIARRIVCDLKEGDAVERGQAFGMIKFGSRCELFIPKSASFKLKVKLKDMVRAGVTVVGSFEDAKPGRAHAASAEEGEQILEEIGPGERDAAPTPESASAAHPDDEQVLEEIPSEAGTSGVKEESRSAGEVAPGALDERDDEERGEETAGPDEGQGRAP